MLKFHNVVVMMSCLLVIGIVMTRVHALKVCMVGLRRTRNFASAVADG